MVGRNRDLAREKTLRAAPLQERELDNMRRRRLGREFFITAGYRAFHLKPIHPRILVNFLRVWLSPIAVT